MISFFWEQYFRSEDDSAGRRSLINLASLISKIVLWTLLGLLILSNFGVNISALITGLGIGGVALALAVQRVLGDFLAYVSIVLDRTFEVGTFIVVGDFKGTVEHVGVRSTQVRSLSGEKLRFPNSDLLNSRIQNFKSLRGAAGGFHLGGHLPDPGRKAASRPRHAPRDKSKRKQKPALTGRISRGLATRRWFLRWCTTFWMRSTWSTWTFNRR